MSPNVLWMLGGRVYHSAASNASATASCIYSHVALQGESESGTQDEAVYT